jgi:hypothetical protein
MYVHYDNCPKCHAELSDFDGIQVCDYCAWEPQDELGCPRCLNNEIYDAEGGYCHNCGYSGTQSVYEPIQDGPPTCGYCGEREEPYHFCDPNGEELLPAVDLVESYEIARKTENVVSLNRMTPASWAENAMNTKNYTTNGKPWPFGTYKDEPYQPFFDLIEDLKKWHVKVEKTSDKGRLHTWVNKMASKGAGCDTTHMAKAFGPRVWIPESQWGTKTGYLSLVHEATHAKDFWKFLCLPFFLMQNLLPFGPSFVALFEYRAYVAAFKAEKEVYGSLLPKATERVAAALASRGYRYCFPFPKLMTKLLNRAIGD